MAGCDYLPSLPGIGIGKSFKFFSRSTNGDLNSVNVIATIYLNSQISRKLTQMLCRLPGCLNMPQLEVSSEYRDSFVKAELTFLHQLVYDPIKRKLVPLKPYPAEIEASTLPFAGEYLKDDVAFQLALGNLNVETLAKMDDYSPDTAKRNKSAAVTKHPSIWSRNFIGRESSAISAETIAVVTRETCVEVEFSLAEKTNSTPKGSDSKAKKLDRSRSPVLTARKRKRVDENCTPISNKSRWSLPSELLKEYSEDYAEMETKPVQHDPCDIFSQSSSTKRNSSCSPSETPLKRKSPFAKLKSPEEGTSPSTPTGFALKRTTGQVRKIDTDGNEIIASSYFCEEKIDSTGQTKKAILGLEEPTALKEAIKTVEVSVSRYELNDNTLTLNSKVAKPGCRVSGLSKRSVTKDGKIQLSISSMFSRVKQ